MANCAEHHVDRILPAVLDWAKLLRRTFAIDALRCGQCGGRLRPLAAITDKGTARRILEHLGLDAELALAGPRRCDEPESDVRAAPE
jgi:hypothetical protein